MKVKLKKKGMSSVLRMTIDIGTITRGPDTKEYLAHGEWGSLSFPTEEGAIGHLEKLAARVKVFEDVNWKPCPKNKPEYGEIYFVYSEGWGVDIARFNDEFVPDSHKDQAAGWDTIYVDPVTHFAEIELDKIKLPKPPEGS
jgi:hypothetical protein